jgi:hypothetical protein
MAGGARVFELRAGKIRRTSDYLDVYTVTRQLGLLPALEEAGTPTAGTPAR